MRPDLIYSSTTRSVGERNNIDNFKLGIKRLEDSKFKYANLNFHEFPLLLDKENYEEVFNDLVSFLNSSSITFNIAHTPIHFPFIFNYFDEREDKEILNQRILKSIEIASKCNVKRIVMHIGTYVDDDFNYDIEKSIECNIKYLEPFVEKANKYNMLLAIENGTTMKKDEPRFNGSAPSIDELIKIVEHFNNKYKKEVMGICFDFGHANVANPDFYQDIVKAGKMLKVTHIHDNYRTDTHNQIFDGTIDWGKVKKALDEIDYNGELTSEVAYPKEKLADTSNIDKTYDYIRKIHLEL